MTTPSVEVPDVIGEIVGWRAWKVRGDMRFPLLASVTHSGTVWHPSRWTYATCDEKLVCRKANDVGSHRIPGEHCTCGLYAARDREQLVQLGYGEGGTQRQPVFIGEVGFVGKVIPGSQGWRAEKGRIRRLIVPPDAFRWVEPLERLYRVPVEVATTTVIVSTLKDLVDETLRARS
jgi:hypothetical protein